MRPKLRRALAFLPASDAHCRYRRRDIELAKEGGMRRLIWRVPVGALLVACPAQNALPQKVYTWHEIRENYLNLVGSYLTAASQLNLVVGREVIQ